MVAVGSSNVEQNCLRCFEKWAFKHEKIHSVLGRVRYMDSYTDIYYIIDNVCTRVIHMRVCAIICRCTVLPLNCVY